METTRRGTIAATSGLAADLRAGARALRQSPGMALLVMGTLGLGIAVNTTVFSWVDSVLLRPIPGAAEPGQLAALEQVPTTGQTQACAYPDYRDYQRQADLFSGLAAWHFQAFMVGQGAGARRVYGQIVSANFFAVLGVKPVAGRVFAYNEDRDVRAGYPLAVISHRLWKAQFGGAQNVLGTAVRINGHPLTIVGVAPPDFNGSIPGLTLDMWVHLSMIHEMGGVYGWPAANRNAKPLLLIGRLKPGVTADEASAQVRTIARRIAALFPDTHQGVSARVVPIWESQAGAQGVLRDPLRILLAVSCLVLLIACANVANLLLARAVARQREYAVRLAIGARPSRVIREVMAGSTVLALPGLAAGLIMAMWMGQALTRLMPPGDLPLDRLANVELNGHVLLFASALALLCSLLAGLPPALHASRTNIVNALHDYSRGSTVGRQSLRARHVLVMLEVALATVAVVGAGLFERTFRKVNAIDLGFVPGGVQKAELYLASAGYAAYQEKLFCRRLKQKLTGMPGVEAASYSIETPLLQGGDEAVEVEGYTPRRGESMVIPRNNVGPDYFRVMRIPLLAGRDFTERDDMQAKQPVAIVNQAFAQQYFGAADPIGHRMRIAQGPWATIVGVARNSKYGGPLEKPRPYYYAPFQQYFGSGHNNNFFVRSSLDPAAAEKQLRRAIAEMEPTAGIAHVEPLQASVDVAMYAHSVAARLMAVLGVLSLLLAVVGLYSVLSYAVSERTQEIGIRMALGAAPWKAARLVLGHVAAITGPGLALGIACGAGAAGWAQGMLAGVSPADPVALGGAVIVLSLVAVVAGLAPALRATRVSPAEALRSQ
ncbi:MAG TPA: ABC transporter permease [Bryobacteraceae bacterium]|nr:ABC transporter permease [Bryobacteraceae bacterium]